MCVPLAGFGGKTRQLGGAMDRFYREEAEHPNLLNITIDGALRKCESIRSLL
jgi:hypothetical protein